MILKRTICGAIVAFAFLSLIAPWWGAVEAVETTALLAARPWEKLVSLLFFEPAPHPPFPLPPLPDERESMASWWRPVLSVPGTQGGWVALGGRARTPIPLDADSLRIDMGHDPPVAPDDPVVAGNALIGFVDRLSADGEVRVQLLRHKDSRVVAVEAEGPVAGEKIYFAAGGGRSRLEGCIRLSFPSSRYGIASGIRTFTSSLYNRGYLPPGLFVGEIRSRPGNLGDLQLRAGLLPPVAGDALCRVAVLVPRARPGVEGREPIPRLRLEPVDVSLSLPPGRITSRAFMRVGSGLEAGLAKGDLVVSGGYLTGAISGSGVLAATARLFLAPGEVIELAHLDRAGPRSVRLQVLDRTGPLCTAMMMDRGDRLAIGSPLYLPGEAAEGGEVYPVCRLVSVEHDGRVQLLCAAIGDGTEGFCLVSIP